MNSFEQDFYQFVKDQLAKKRKLKDSSPNSRDETDEVEKNRLFNENISKVLKQERKKMRISKVSREQMFDRRFKDFASMDTFLDIKPFLKHLSSQKITKQQAKKRFHTLKRIDYDSDNDDIFDYAEIIQKSKRVIEKSTVIRHQPEISGYLISDNQIQQTNIEELKTDDDKFYNCADQLFQDIAVKAEQLALQQKYDRERRFQKKPTEVVVPPPPKPTAEVTEENEKMEEMIRQKAKQFKEQTDKVLKLLERTTKQLYNKKEKRGVAKQVRTMKKITEPIPQLSEISEQRSTFHQFYPETSRSLSKLPQLSPNTSITYKPVYSHRTFLSQGATIEKPRIPLIPIPKLEFKDKARDQFKQFIQKIDRAKASFDKSNQTDKEIIHIQQRIIKNMNKIGEIPLESLKILNKKEFEISNLKTNKLKKARPMQIL